MCVEGTKRFETIERGTLRELCENWGIYFEPLGSSAKPRFAESRICPMPTAPCKACRSASRRAKRLHGFPRPTRLVGNRECLGKRGTLSSRTCFRRKLVQPLKAEVSRPFPRADTTSEKNLESVRTQHNVEAGGAK